MRVYQVMSCEPIAVDIGDDVDDAYELMHEHALTQLPVLEDGRVVGVVDEAAVQACLEREDGAPLDPPDLSVAAVMRHDPETCRPWLPIADAGAFMSAKHISTMYVTTGDGSLLGAIDDTDLVDWYGDAEADAELAAFLPALGKAAHGPAPLYHH